MKLKKGDKVVIISGADKGKQGTVLKILNKTNRVVLEGDGLTKVKKHLKPSKQILMVELWKLKNQSTLLMLCC